MFSKIKSLFSNRKSTMKKDEFLIIRQQRVLPNNLNVHLDTEGNSGYEKNNSVSKETAFQPYSPDYMQHERKIIKEISEKVQQDLLQEKDYIGQCIPTSRELSRLLNEAGINSYVVFGNVQIDYSSDTGLRPITPYDMAFEDGHAWVVALPYTVVDLTIKYQHISKEQQSYIPALVMDDSCARFKDTDDLKQVYPKSNYIVESDSKQCKITYMPSKIFKS